MGIYNDAILVYGIEFSYDEIKHLKKVKDHTLEVNNNNSGSDSDSDSHDIWMPNLWEDLGFILASNYYDQEEEYYTYIIGKKITRDMNRNEFLQEINENDTILYLKQSCEKHNLKYTEPKILCRVNIT
jgi:hypothetical protein